MANQPVFKRRYLLAKLAAITLSAPLLAGCGSAGQSSPGGNPTPGDSDNSAAGNNDDTTSQPADPTFDGWLDNVDNYSQLIDKSNTDQITISVGAKGNNGNFAFDPPAVRISLGTQITWEWTGLGGQHNVVETNGVFESELTDEANHTFTHTLQDSGTYKYSCIPHETIGMKGVIVVD